MTDLHARARLAFGAEFRDKLCNAVTLAVLKGVPIVPWDDNSAPVGCNCPEGCLPACLLNGERYPPPSKVWHMYDFRLAQHESFQTGFDYGNDDGTPEAALGLLYRRRFTTSPQPARVRSNDVPGEE